MLNENSISSDSIRVIYGPVSIVKAIPSREISVISVEVPEEMHVEVTNLLYGRDALIALVELKNVGYGVLDPHSMSDADALTDLISMGTNPQIRAIHGCVTGVRAINSRGVTVISMEVPEEAHVEVTQMIYGREVIVMPVALGASTAYGVLTGRGAAIHQPNQRAGSAALPRTDATPPPVRLGIIRQPPPVNLIQWAGKHCTEDEFQNFLGVRNEAQAIEAIRRICNIGSRRELTNNAPARQIFIAQIYQPYTHQTRSVS